MKSLKSDELKLQMNRLRERIRSDKEQLTKLEHELDVVIEQERERQSYINSKEIAQTIEKSTGKSVDMSTIKRWADKGYLGVIYDEREKFSALDVGSGKQRNVFERTAVLRFLLERQYIRPAFEVLDLVRAHKLPGQPIATIISQKLGPDGFEYAIQLESDTEILEKMREEELESCL
ncbi:hypothetical protein [Alicyclobacillus mengziensis]|uniref:Uncharacterized protein n=1 Tax=Alicyclobacillus mengziensis TaxID=2931921 RepID=A0A9X7Z963_9BACL|nr:hypothetical protein [Alicyclobacillus mengziensis]QSO49250.1 hypothetical protein JZ786_10195 [Alicyclobacillus mengziensis]